MSGSGCGPCRAAPWGEPVRAAEDLHLEVVLADGPHDTLYPLAVDGPSGEVAEATEHGEGVHDEAKGVEGQMRRLVDVEALEGGQAGGARREEAEVLVPEKEKKMKRKGRAGAPTAFFFPDNFRT